MDHQSASRGSRRAATAGGGVLLLGVLMFAANQRAAISAVGPVLPLIGTDTGMGEAQLGALAAIPVATFALASVWLHRVGERYGVDRALLGALVLLGFGVVVRSLPVATPGHWIIFAGTALIGVSVALGNVLLPVVVGRDFGVRTPTVTGYYISVQSLVAAAAAGLAVPIADLTGSWRVALGVWGVLILLALTTWWPRMRHTSAPAPPAASTDQAAPVWRSLLAWQVAGYFGLQSASYFLLLNWLPTVEQDLGVPPAVAGLHLSVFLTVVIVGSVAAPRMLRLGPDQRWGAALAPAGLVTSMVGLVLAPGLAALWAALAGTALGASMVIALSLINLRAGTPSVAGRLSAMVQATAYAGVAVALFIAGLIRDLLGAGPHLLFLVVIAAVAQAAVGLSVGRDRLLTPR